MYVGQSSIIAMYQGVKIVRISRYMIIIFESFTQLFKHNYHSLYTVKMKCAYTTLNGVINRTVGY